MKIRNIGDEVKAAYEFETTFQFPPSDLSRLDRTYGNIVRATR